MFIMTSKKAYEPLPSYADSLTDGWGYSRPGKHELPPGWRSSGPQRGDPLDGRPHPDYQPHYPKGKCKRCGKDLPEKSGRGPKPSYCVDCAPKVSKKRQAVRNQRKGAVRSQVGVVPFRARTFVVETRRFIWYLKRHYGDKKEWLPATNEHVVVRSRFGSYLSGEWENGWKLGTFEDKSGRTVPKGEEPERAANACDECGAPLKIEHARGRLTGGKIGAKELVCSKCGLVHGRGVTSYPEAAADDYREGGSNQSW